jgi:hypothetical protein
MPPWVAVSTSVLTPRSGNVKLAMSRRTSSVSPPAVARSR